MIDNSLHNSRQLTNMGSENTLASDNFFIYHR